MRRGTTATISVPVDSTLVAAVDATKIRLTVIQGSTKVQKEGDEVTVGSDTFSATLTPDETLEFDADNSAATTKAFVKWVDTSSATNQTSAITVPVLPTDDEEDL